VNLSATRFAQVTASLERRTITGQLVPWDTIGNTSAGPTRFAAGSVELPSDLSRVKLLKDHNTADPIGYLVDAHDDGTGLFGTFKIPETSAGDEALLQAAEKLRDGLSVGVTLNDWSRSADALEVVSSSLSEVSQVAIPAFDDARALSVAASANNDTIPPEPEPATEPEQETPVSEQHTTEAEAAPVITAAAPVPYHGRPAAKSIDLNAAAALIASANRGDVTIAEVRAALGASTTGDLEGIVPQAYVSELVGLINPGRPTLNAIRNRALPAAGMKVTYPRWAVLPTVDKQLTELAEVESTAAEITLQDVTVGTWAGANELSLQAVDRSDPSAIAAIIEALSVAFARKTNAAVIGDLIDAAGAATTVGSDSPVDVVSGLIGALDPEGTPAGPLFLSIAWDLMPAWLSVSQNDRPAFWDGRVQFGSMVPTLSADGLTVMVDRDLPAGHALLGSSLGATWWQNQGAPVEIRAVDVSILGIDLGVYGYGALSVEYPGAFAYCDLS
jgi:HK97 family phage prohead protease